MKDRDRRRENETFNEAVKRLRARLAAGENIEDELTDVGRAVLEAHTTKGGRRRKTSAAGHDTGQPGWSRATARTGFRNTDVATGKSIDPESHWDRFSRALKNASSAGIVFSFLKAAVIVAGAYLVGGGQIGGGGGVARSEPSSRLTDSAIVAGLKRKGTQMTVPAGGVVRRVSLLDGATEIEVHAGSTIAYDILGVSSKGVVSATLDGEMVAEIRSGAQMSVVTEAGRATLVGGTLAVRRHGDTLWVSAGLGRATLLGTGGAFAQVPITPSRPYARVVRGQRAEHSESGEGFPPRPIPLKQSPAEKPK